MTTETEGAADPVVAAEAAAEAPEAQDHVEEPATEAAPDGEGEQPKPKPTAQERIDELTRLRREAERDAAYWKAKATQPADQPAEERQAPKPSTGDGRPDPEDFDFGIADERYLEALTDWKAEQAVQKALGSRDAQQRTTQVVQTFQERASKAYPQGEPEGLKAYRALDTVPPAVQDVVLASEVGHRIADHLGANLNELRRLADMPPHMQAYELGKLESRFANPAPAPSPKTVSDAPPPPTTVARGAGGKFTVAPDTDDFAAFEKQYG